jgi:dolichyl-phosphate beta-glucosyltransferase
VYGFLNYFSPQPRAPTENEKYYRDAKADKKERVPNLLQDAPSLTLSCIVPAFDESKRIVTMLTEAIEYLSERKGDYEIIIVDDGSRDDTMEVVSAFAKTRPDVDIKILALEKNRGKGGAVTQVIEYW